MKQALFLRTNAGGFIMLASENPQSIQEMAKYISEIIAATATSNSPSAEDYKHDLHVVREAQQRFGLDNFAYYDYRWRDEESIKKWIRTGDKPELGELPRELLDVIGSPV
jgi:hypothetical protein